MKYEEDKYYHLYNRGANKNNIFFSPENYHYCLKLLAKYSSQYSVQIFCYCLMPNHYHLLVNQQDGGSISHFVQTVFNSYTQAFNKITGHSGTLFQGRVKGIEITTDEYTVRLCRYIHNNPVVARLVKFPAEWEYSDYRAWIGERDDSLTTFSLRDEYFENAENYKKYIEEYENDNSIGKFTFDE